MKNNRNYLEKLRRSTAMLLAIMMIFNGSGMQSIAEMAGENGIEFVHKTSGAEFVVENEEYAPEEGQESVVVIDNAENNGDEEDGAVVNPEENAPEEENKEAEVKESEQEEDSETGEKEPGEEANTKEVADPLKEEVPSLSKTGLSGTGEKIKVHIVYKKEVNTLPGSFEEWAKTSDGDGDVELTVGDTNVQVYPDYAWLEAKVKDLYGYHQSEKEYELIEEVKADQGDIVFEMKCVRKTITFDENVPADATCNLEDIVILNGCEAFLPAYDGKRPGYTFKRYKDHTTGTVYEVGAKFYCNEEEDKTISLDAVWEKNTVKIDYAVKDAKGGTVDPSSVTIEAVATTAGSATVTPQDGWHVLGWAGVRKDGPVISIPESWISADKKTLTPGTTAYDQDTKSHTYENAAYTVTMTENLVDVGFRGNGKGDTVTNVPATCSSIKYNGETRTVPNNIPVRTGYKFLGWSEDEDDDGKGTLVKGGDDLHHFAKDYDEDKKEVIYYAVWEPLTYKVSYKDQGDKPFSGDKTGLPTAHTFGTVTELKTTTKTGYAFKGWYTNPAATGEAVTSLTAKGYTADITLYAKWELVQYTLTYLNMQDGTADNPSGYKYDAAVYLKDPNRTGYTFDGWTGTGLSGKTKNVVIATNSTGNREYTANWTANKYDITYRDQEDKPFTGTHVDDFPTKHTYDTATTLTTTTRLGYYFNGWYRDAACTNGPITSVGGKDYTDHFKLFAKWTAGKYTVRFNAEGGTPATKTQEITFDADTKLEANTFTKNGYKFIGWTRIQEKETPDDDLLDQATVKNLCTDKDKTIDLYAIWVVEDFSISYDLQGGALPFGKSNTKIYNLNTDTFTLVNPEKTNYEFIGWTLNGSTEKVMTVTIPKGAYPKYENLNFKAHWAPKEYHITYNLTEGEMKEGESNPATFTVESDPITLKNPIRTGFNFDGWTSTTHAGKDPAVVIPTGSAGDRTYTANWQIKEITLTFNMNGHGTQIAPYKDNYKSDLIKPADPKETGWVFGGWYKDPYFSEAFDWTLPMPAVNQTLYAKWTKGTFEIRFEMNGHGTQVPTIRKEFGDPITKPNTPSEFGSEFVGWYTDQAFEQPYVFPDTMPGENVDLYANWNVGRYTFTYDLMYDGKKETIYRNLDNAVTLSDATRVGYKFDGWYKEETLTTPYTQADADLLAGTQEQPTVYAKWSERSYNFTYNLRDGSWTEPELQDVESRLFTKGITLRGAEKVARKGYSFGGWYPDTTFAANYTQAQASALANTTAEPTVYAKWSQIMATITYRATEGGTALVTGTTSQDYEWTPAYGGALSGATATVNPGYTFLGWFKGDDLVSTELVLTKAAILGERDMLSSETYTARFSMNHYGIVFQWDESKDSEKIDASLIDNPNSDIPSSTFYADLAYSQLFQLPYGYRLEKEGYRLLGWYVDGNFRTPGQLVSELSAAKGGVVKVWPCWTPEKVVISYISTGFGETTRELDEVTAASASSVQDVAASVSDASGYRFKAWKMKDASGNFATLSDAKVLTGDQIRTVAWNATYSCYVNTDIYCDFEEITYTLELYGLSESDEPGYPYSDKNPYRIENIRYNQEITLLTWEELKNAGYTQFDIRGSVFKSWNEYDSAKKVIRDFANAQNVSKLTTTDNGVVRLVSTSTPKTAQLEYAHESDWGGTLKKVEAGKVTASGGYIAWAQNAYADPETVPIVKAVPGDAYKFLKWQISENGVYRDLQADDPVIIGSEKTTAGDKSNRTGTILPKKRTYGGDEAYVSYTVNAVFAYRDVRINFYNYNATPGVDEPLAYVDTTYDGRALAPKFSTFTGVVTPSAAGKTYKFVGWSKSQNQVDPANYNTSLVMIDGENTYLVNCVYADEVNLFAVWTSIEDPVVIRYHQNDDRWSNINRKFAVVPRTDVSAPNASLSDVESTAIGDIRTKEEAGSGQLYWDAWYRGKSAVEDRNINVVRTPVRNGSGTLVVNDTSLATDTLHFYANWIRKAYDPEPAISVVVHYNGHIPDGAPVDDDKVPAEDATYTLTYTAEGGSELIRRRGGLYRSNWKKVFGTADNPPTSLTDSYTFSGWYTTEECKTRWVFHDDKPKKGATTGVYETQRDIWAQWSAPATVVISYAAGEGGTAYVRDAAGEPTAQSYETVIVTDKKAMGAVLIPDVGYHFKSWEGKEIATGETITIDPSWIDGLLFNPGHPAGRTVYTEAAYTARFEANNYKINFYSEGGATLINDEVDVPAGEAADYYQKLTYNTTLTLPQGTSLSKDGCTFVGWKVMDVDGAVPAEKTQYAKGMSVINLSAKENGVVNLSAVWEPNVVYLSYEQSGGGVVYVTGTLPEDEVKTEEIYAPDGKYVTPVAGETATYVRGVTAKANTGYKFEKWTGKAYTDDDDETGHPIDMTGKTEVLVPGKTGPVGSDPLTIYEKATYKANFLADKYKVVFHNNTKGSDTATYTQDTEFVWDSAAPLMTLAAIRTATATTSAFEKEGHSFQGWRRSDSVKHPVLLDDGASVSDIEDLDEHGVGTGWSHLYAVWAVLSYEIRFNSNGGTPVETIKQPYGTDVTTPSDPTKKGYTFRGWDQEVPKTIPAKNMTLNANWEENTYKFTYHVNGGVWDDGTMQDVIERPFSQAITLRSNLDIGRVGYTFGGWFTDPEFSDASLFMQDNATALAETTDVVDVYAKWIPKDDIRYSILHIRQKLDGTYDEEDIDLIELQIKDGTGRYLMGRTGKMTDVAAQAQLYTGFMTDTVVNVPIAATGSSVAKIYYSRNKHTVSYKAKGHGTTPSDAVRFYGADISDLNKTLTETGYIFEGWYSSDPDASTSPKKYVFNTMPNSDVTVYAKWSPVEYTVQFAGNGSDSGSMQNQVFRYDEAQNLSANVFGKVGYSFQGWDTVASGSSVVYKDKQSVSNLSAEKKTVTLTAVWAPNSYSVKFNGNGSTSPAMLNQLLVYDAAPTALNANTYQKPGYEFRGWDTSPVASTVVLTDSQAVRNLTTEPGGIYNVYAVWQANTYTVLFDGNNETSGTMIPQLFVYGEKPKTLEKNMFQRTGYTFIGWNRDKNATVKEFDDEEKVSDLSGEKAGIVTLYAIWSPNDVDYKIEHWKQKVGTGTATESDYVLEETDELQGKSDSTVLAKVKNYTGFVSPTEVNIKIAPDGSTVHQYYYNRDKYLFTLKSCTGVDTTGSTTTQLMQYGATVKLTSVHPGYDFKEWTAEPSSAISDTEKKKDQNASFTMPACAVTVTPKAEIIKYKINYKNLNGGTHSNPAIYTYENSVTFTDASRTGYDFSGWYKEAGHTTRVYEIATNSTGEKTVYAKWQPHSWKVSFDKTTGESISYDEKTVTFDSTYGNGTPTGMPTGVKTGYHLKGWYTQITEGTKVEATTKVTTDKDHTLYARWEANKYKVRFNGNKSTSGSMNDQVLTYDGAEEKLSKNTYVRVGYEFVGWATSSTATASNYDFDDEDLVKNLTTEENGVYYLYAVWSPINFYLKYSTNYPADAAVSYAQKVSDAQDHTYDVPFSVASIKNVPGTTVPDWSFTADSFYDVKYKMNGWTLKASPGSGDKRYQAGDDGSQIGTVKGETYTLYANWIVKQHTITYHYNYNFDDKPDESQNWEFSVASASVATLKTPTRDGYEFGGWFKEKGCVNELTQAEVDNWSKVPYYTAQNTDVWAKWTPITYTVKYDPNTPSECSTVIQYPCTDVQTWTYDAISSKAGKANKLPNPANKMTLEGYVFWGWFEVPEHDKGTRLGTWGDVVTKNLTKTKDAVVTLYAHWKPLTTTHLTVNHWKQDLYAETYTLAETVVQKHTSDKIAKANVKTYPGFTSPDPVYVKVLADGSTVVDYYYTRNSYYYTIATSDGVDVSTASPSSGTTKLQYGTTIYLNATHLDPGFDWQKWVSSNTGKQGHVTTETGTTITMPDGDLKMTATAKAHEYKITYFNVLNQKSPIAFEEREKKSNGHYPSLYTIRDATHNISTPLPAARPGYGFEGWNTTGSWSTTPVRNYSIETGTTGDIKLYAMYGLLTLGVGVDYTPGYSWRNGKNVYDESITYTVEQTTYICDPTPSDANTQKFDKWRRTQNGIVTYFTNGSEKRYELQADDDKAQYKALWQFRYTFVPNGGKWLPGDQTGNFNSYRPEEEGLTLFTDADIVKTGYHLADGTTGWFEDPELTNEFTEAEAAALANTYATPCLYAKWEANNYKVHFNASTGTGTMEDESFTYDAEKALTANAFEKSGYTFQGWDTNVAGKTVVYSEGKTVKNLTTVKNGTVQLYAVWTPNVYHVTYDANTPSQTSGAVTGMDTGIHDWTVDKEETLADAPSLTGYTFDGWFSQAVDGTKLGMGGKNKPKDVNLATRSDAQAKVYAHWHPNTYTVKYDGNKNTGGSTAQQTHTYDEPKDLTANGFVRKGYTFQGWSAVKDSAKLYDDTQTVVNLASAQDAVVTLYAVWKANTYKITYNANTPSGASTAVTNLDPKEYTWTVDQAAQLTYAPALEGYTFEGWYMTKDKAAQTDANYLGAADGTKPKDKNLAYEQDATASVYAKWTANGYTVTFNGNGNTGGSTAKQNHTFDQEKALTANGFVKTGYHFTGWATSSTAGAPVKYIDKATVKNLTSVKNGNVDLYAVWEPNTYFITYNGNQGSASTPVTNVDPIKYTWTYDHEEPLTYAPVHTGYTFDGWFDAPTGGTKLGGANGTKPDSINLSAVQDDNKVVYAHWKANTYKVTFDGNTSDGGTKPADMTYTFDVSQNLNANSFTKTGYHFTGWATDSSATSAKYKNQQSVQNLAAEQDTVVKLYAVWAKNNYTVVFDGNGHTGGSMESQAHTYDVSKNLSKNQYVRTGYTFIGWATTASGDVLYGEEALVKNLTAEENGTFKLYAKWKANTYKIRYSANTPSGASTVVTSLDPNEYTWTVGQPATLTYAPALEGYTFGGWYMTKDKADQTDANYLGAANGTKPADKNLAFEQDATASVYAKWTANIYTVKFDGNGGTDGTPMASMGFTFDVEQALNSNTFARTGYTFQGWNTDSAATTVQYTDGQTVKNLTSAPNGEVTLYAVWKANTYKVTYNGNKPVSASTTVTDLDTNEYTWTYDSEETLTSAPKLEGYTFLGWYDKASGGELLGMGGGTKAADKNLATGAPGSTSAVVYAHWQPNTYTVRFSGNGHTAGATPSDMQFTYDVSRKLNANNFSRIGYEYAGWATASTATQREYSDQANVKNLTSVPDGIVTLYAVWNPNTYNVHFNIATGSTVDYENKTVTYGKPYGYGTPEGLPGAQKTGYTFLGWFTEEEGGTQRKVTDIVDVAENQELYSHWTPNRYRVRFAANGATGGTMDDQEMIYDQSANLNDNRYSRKGYTFIGWASASDAAIPDYRNKAEVKNLTTAPQGTYVLYAIWSVNSYNVHFDLNGGDGSVPDQMIVFGSLITKPADPTRPGYRFRGWQYNGRDWNFDYDTVQEAMTLTAIWEVESSGDEPSHPEPSNRPQPNAEKRKRGHWELWNEECRMWKYHFDDGTYATGGWYYLDNEYTKTPGNEYAWFFFGKDEYMQWGWIRVDNPYSWYYTDVLSQGDLGAWWRGWLDDPQDGRRYFLDRNTGVMYTGWHTIDGKEYYFETVGIEAGKAWYLNIIDPATGYKVWLYRDSNLHPLGSMYRNEMTPDGHFVDENGVKVR